MMRNSYQNIVNLLNIFCAFGIIQVVNTTGCIHIISFGICLNHMFFTEKGDHVMIQKIQKFGAAMLAPVLLFAFSGMIVGISVLFTNQLIFGSLAAEGTLWLQFWTIVNKGAWTVFNQMPLLFVVGLPIGLAKKEQARCCMEALVLYLTFNYFVNQILTYWGSYVGIAMDSTAKTSGLTSVAGIRTLDTGMLGAIVIAGVVVWLHNRFYETELPECLAIFRGSCFICMIGFVAMLVLAGAFVIIWPMIQHGISMVQQFLISTGNFGLWIYGLLLKLLLPFGMHHFVYAPIEFDSVLVDGGTVAYWAQHLGEFAQTTEPLKELFPAGGFGLKGLVKVFGVPGAALALYSTAKPEKKKIVAGLLIPATLTSIVAGVTEPLEYTFLFVAPVLFVIHAVLSATLMVVSYSLGVVGSFGGGLIDWAAQNYIPLGANHWQMYLIHILVGLVFVGIWFVVFRTVILKFNLKTPGREDDDATEVSLKTKADYQAKTNHKKAEKTAYAKQIIEALGGPENILEVTNCMTRLRVSVKDAAQVQGNDYFRSIGAHGVVKVGNAVQVIVGVNAPFIRGTVNELLDSERSVS